jgi:hypothetical protein
MSQRKVTTWHYTGKPEWQPDKDDSTFIADIRSIAFTYFHRFTIDDCVDEYIRQNPDVEMAVKHFDGSHGRFNLYQFLHEGARHALASWKDKNRHRLYINEGTDAPGSLWFHRKDATYKERITFGEYLIAKGGRLTDEGKYHVKEGNKARRRMSHNGT